MTKELSDKLREIADEIENMPIDCMKLDCIVARPEIQNTLYIEDSNIPLVDPQLNSAEPGYLVPYLGDDPNVESLRITDHSLFAQSWRLPPRRSYAARNAYSADGTVYGIGQGSVDSTTYQVGNFWPFTNQVVMGWVTNYIYGFHDASTGLSTTNFGRANPDGTGVTYLHDFANDGYSNINIGGGNGELSKDDRCIAMTGTKNGQNYYFTYDLVTDQIIGEILISNITGFAADSFHMSCSGQYVYVHHSSPGQTNENWVFDKDFTNGRLLNGIVAHYDTAQDANGDDVVFYVDSNGQNYCYFRLSDGSKFTLGDGDGGHVSGSADPGWITISTTGQFDPDRGIFHDPVVGFARVEHDTSQPGVQVNTTVNGKPVSYTEYAAVTEFELWGRNRSSLIYNSQSQATSNRDRTEILTMSDWTKTGTAYDANQHLLRLSCV